MKTILSSAIILSILFVILAPLANNCLFLGLVLGGISSVLLLLVLIIERFKDKEEEKDDLNKY